MTAHCQLAAGLVAALCLCGSFSREDTDGNAPGPIALEALGSRVTGHLPFDASRQHRGSALGDDRRGAVTVSAHASTEPKRRHLRGAMSREGNSAARQLADEETYVVSSATREIQKNSKLRHKCRQGTFCQYMQQNDISTSDESLTKMYDAYHSSRGNSAYEVSNDLVIKLLTKYFPPEKFPAVLDGGVGQCHMIRKMIASKYTHVRGHEISRYAIENFCPGLEVSQGLLKSTPYAEGEFDAITSIDVMEHIPVKDVLATLKEIRRISRGIFIFKLGPCAENCGGFCALKAIHPSGICKRLNANWWEQQALLAGFHEVAPTRLHEYERMLGAYSIGCCDSTGHNSLYPAIKCDPQGHGFMINDHSQVLPCDVAEKGHNYFIFHAD